MKFKAMEARASKEENTLKDIDGEYRGVAVNS